MPLSIGRLEQNKSGERKVWRGRGVESTGDGLQGREEAAVGVLLQSWVCAWRI